MTSALIGIASGLAIIIFIALLKRFDKSIIYGLALSAIGFLYVGFAWSDITQVIINTAQAIFFLFLAYYGIKKSLYFLIAGYFLHGLWDLIYGIHADAGLIPPDYDLFCSFLDFTIGLYLLIFKNRISGNASTLS